MSAATIPYSGELELVPDMIYGGLASRIIWTPMLTKIVSPSTPIFAIQVDIIHY